MDAPPAPGATTVRDQRGSGPRERVGLRFASSTYVGVWRRAGTGGSAAAVPGNPPTRLQAGAPCRHHAHPSAAPRTGSADLVAHLHRTISKPWRPAVALRDRASCEENDVASWTSVGRISRRRNPTKTDALSRYAGVIRRRPPAPRPRARPAAVQRVGLRFASSTYVGVWRRAGTGGFETRPYTERHGVTTGRGDRRSPSVTGPLRGERRSRKRRWD